MNNRSVINYPLAWHSKKTGSYCIIEAQVIVNDVIEYFTTNIF
ncbi:hypothetical protein KLQU111852_19325 [Klebsiella quasipneumoniae subsp. quasipneumoniae]|nr:hypothetical protein SB01124_01983 [Klebsiella quasipneumoniae subsp. quasipneumoniae]